MLSLAHSITIECSDFSSCGNVQFQYVCFENWSISLMQNELFYLSFSHSKKDFYMYLSQVLYWLLMHISEKLCWHSFPLILISWLTMIIICTRLSKVSLRLTNIRKLAQRWWKFILFREKRNIPVFVFGLSVKIQLPSTFWSYNVTIHQKDQPRPLGVI